MRLDGVNAMTVGADWRLPLAMSNGLSVNALAEFLLDRIVAFSACGGDIEIGRSKTWDAAGLRI